MRLAATGDALGVAGVVARLEGLEVLHQVGLLLRRQIEALPAKLLSLLRRSRRTITALRMRCT